MLQKIVLRHKYLLLILLLSLLPLYSLLLSRGLIYTQDGWTHLIRGAGYFKALADHNVPVRWAGDLNYGYGMPLFVFEFQVPYLLYSFLILIGCTLANGFKLLLILTYLLSAFFMFQFANAYFKKPQIAFFVTILYQFFPYRFVDMLLRGSIGESFAFSFLPLVLWGIVLLEKKRVVGFVTIATGTALLLLSHLATGGMFIGVGILFLLICQKKEFLIGVLGFLVGFALSGYYWFGAVIEHKYTYGDLFAKNLYKDNFAGFGKLFFPNLTNVHTLRVGDVPVTVGVVGTVILILLVISLFVFKRFAMHERRMLLFATIVSIGSIFMITPLSHAIWDHVNLLRQFQFPWRFLSPLALTIALSGGVFITKYTLSRNHIIVLSLICLLTTFAYWIPQLGYRTVHESDYWNYPLTTTYFGETDVIWSAGPASSYPKKRVDVIAGGASITNLVKRNATQTFSVQAKTNATILSRTEYFPGWKVSVDGKDVPIEFQNQQYRGQITFPVSPGLHQVRLHFGETKIELFGDVMSIFALLLLYPLIRILKRLHE